MVEPASHHPSDLKLRKILGRTCLHENRLSDALKVWVSILEDYPQDVDALLTLGNLYLASGSAKTAEKLYCQALSYSPDNLVIERQILLAQAEFEKGLDEIDPTGRDAIARLLSRLSEESEPFRENEISRAADIVQSIRNSNNPASQVAERLEEIDQLLPALLELNIRQARAEGQADLAQALQSLQISLQARENAVANPERAAQPPTQNTPARQVHAPERLLLLTPSAQPTSARMALLQEVLVRAGCEVLHHLDLPGFKGSQSPELVILSNPHLEPELLEQAVNAAAHRIPILLDLDRDFENLPVAHPDYAAQSLRLPGRSKAFLSALLLANTITVPSQWMAASLHSGGYPAEFIPDGWMQSNPLWAQSAPARATFNLGWSAACGQMEDLAQIRRIVLRVLREFPTTRLVLLGSSQAYQLFDSLPEDRRIFLPFLKPDAYPTLLNQVNLLLVPLQNHIFGQSVSDRVLMEAGIKRIPWVASPAPAFEAWGAGGWLAHSLEEWHTHIRQLVLDSTLCTALGQQGRRKAEERESHRMGETWLQVITTTIQQAHDLKAS